MTKEKQCSRCGETKPLSEFSKERHSKDGLRARCRVCRAADCKEYHNTHREAAAAYQEEYRNTHREEIAASNKRYYDTHREEIASQHKKYRDANPETCLAAQKQWREENREKVAAIQHRRRARKAAATIEDFDIMDAWERDNCTCVYCGGTDSLTIDHIVPLSRGGPHSPENVCVACRRCNSSKGAKDLNEWVQFQA